MNYLTFALQLVTLYGVYRLWRAQPAKHVTQVTPEERAEIEQRLDGYFSEGPEHGNVKPDPKPKQAPAPPAPKPARTPPQGVLEFAQGPTHQRPLWTYSQAQLNMLCVNMRNYAKERKAYNKGEGPCPRVRGVFPPAGSHLKQCLVPHVIDEDTYKAWRTHGRWPVFLTHPNEAAVKHLRHMTKTA